MLVKNDLNYSQPGDCRFLDTSLSLVPQSRWMVHSQVNRNPLLNGLLQSPN